MLRSVGYIQDHTQGICPGITLHRTYVNYVDYAFIPVPGTSVSSVRPCDNTRGTGATFLCLPRTYVSSVCPRYNTRNLCEFCDTFIPLPGTYVSSVRRSYLYLALMCVLYACATMPGVRGQPLYTVLGTSVSSVRLCHNTWKICELCDTFIPVPETSVSSVRLPYPYPASTNPTEHNLGMFYHTVMSSCPISVW